MKQWEFGSKSFDDGAKNVQKKIRIKDSFKSFIKNRSNLCSNNPLCYS